MIENYNIIKNVILYEQGYLSHEETVILFQELIDADIVWILQGSYLRTVNYYLDKNYVTLE